MNTKIKILVLIIACFTVSGCTLKLGKSVSTDGGVYFSSDKGETWIQKVEYLNIGANRSFFKTAQSIFIKQDVNDPRAVYLGTLQDGLIYSFDGGHSWQKSLTGKGVIYDIALDGKNRCVYYVAVANKVYKTEDCSRNWQQIYTDEVKEQSIRSVVVDSYNNNKIYLATSDGRIIKSEDFGNAWKTIKTFTKVKVLKMITNSKDTRKLYVCTSSGGIFKSDNEGIDWVNIVDNIDVGEKNKKSSIFDYQDFELDSSKEDAFLYASKYGIFYSQNGGANWNFIKLLTKPESVKIYSIAMNPKNPNEIYYATSKNFYKSFDGGRKWISKNIPSTKTPIDMLVDLGNPNNIFMAFRQIQK